MLKFFAVYAISVFLFIVIFAAVWQGDSAAASRPAQFTPAVSGENYRQADAFLHKQMQELDELYSSAMTNDMLAAKRFRNSEIALAANLDSLEKEADEVQDEAHKNEWTTMLSNFRTALQSRSNMMGKLALLRRQKAVETTAANKTASAVTGNTAATEELKQQLTQKDEQIASLQNKSQRELAEKNRAITSLQEQLRRGNSGASRQNTGGDDEWRKKYTTIKSRHTELNTAYNALSASFQSVVADNRRLIQQLQQARKQ